MSTSNTFLYSLSLPKRFNLSARVYRRLRKYYAAVLRIPQIEINMNGSRFCFILFFFAGPCVLFVLSLLTLLIP